MTTPPTHGRLAVFDLDGTLALSTAVDEECYVEAVERALGFTPDDDWAGYRHTTDTGILREAVDRRHGRPPTDEETEAVRTTFLALLRHRLSREPELCRAVPGAHALLRRLARSGWRSVIATGGWSTSARLKLAAAALPLDLPLSSSDRFASREEIVEHAIAGVARAEGADSPAPARIVSLGDGVWDVRTARTLALPFVGVGAAERADRLRREGAAVVLQDFSDLAATLAALDTAPPPAATPHPPGPRLDPAG